MTQEQLASRGWPPDKYTAEITINLQDKFLYNDLLWEVTAFDEKRMHCWCQSCANSLDFPLDRIKDALKEGAFKFLPR